jgi:hypothetical protein
MTEEHARAGTRTSKIIWARPEELYAAFLDPAALIDWLPPAEMTGEIHVKFVETPHGAEAGVVGG